MLLVISRIFKFLIKKCTNVKKNYIITFPGKRHEQNPQNVETLLNKKSKLKNLDIKYKGS